MKARRSEIDIYCEEGLLEIETPNVVSLNIYGGVIFVACTFVLTSNASEVRPGLRLLQCCRSILVDELCWQPST